MEEEADFFKDAISVCSVNSYSSGSARRKGREYISLSYCTVYDSAQDLQTQQSDNIEDPVMAAGHEPVKSSNCSDENKTLTSPSVFEGEGHSIDFVLVWTEGSAVSCSEVAYKKREIFERHLREEGLILEQEQNLLFHFIKIHAPVEVLERYAEILKLRMPMKKFDDSEELDESSFAIMQEVKSLVRHLTEFFRVDPTVFPPREHRLTAEFEREKKYLFDVDSENFFTTAVRAIVVDFILERTEFSEDRRTPFCFGVNRLISDGVYSAAYPLHDGDYRQEGCLRHALHKEWASLRKWITYQPIDYIKDYFGVKIGLYFAWLGFYTYMLIPAALVGLICFSYGLATMHSDTLSEDICNRHLNITMCPLCDTCPYWNLADTCHYARFMYLFDNSATIFFAFFMSFWGTVFLELWKRYAADITYRWHLSGFKLQAEHPRPEYLARLRNAKYKTNVITQTKEPYVPFWKVRVPATILSFSVVLLLISMAVGSVFGVVLYRMASIGPKSIFVGQNKFILIPATAAVINLVCIMLLNYLYNWLAVILTEMELLRTQTEFDDSLTLKIYLFQFVNYYASIFYVALLKGKFVGYPAKYNLVFGWRQEECSPGGCLMELCIQLSIIMVGKQAYSAVMEMVIPLLIKWWNNFKVKEEEKESGKIINQWTEDYKLLDWGPRGLCHEYLEMVLQYGFVTLFVAPFPLAPFFALLNNILEMKLDAKKFLRFYRRPVPKRVKNIGVWFHILDILGHLSVVTNALIIAFSSNFIPRIVYTQIVSPNNTDVGFLNHSLAYFDTRHFSHSLIDVPPVEICRYPEYRNPPWDEHPYKRPLIYWHILAVRLIFVVVFQNVIGLITNTVKWLIPDIPRSLHEEMLKEAYLTNEIIIAQERKLAQNMTPGRMGSRDFLTAERNAAANDDRAHKKRKKNNPEEIGRSDFHIV